MTENRLPDYLDHIEQAAADACSFVVLGPGETFNEIGAFANLDAAGMGADPMRNRRVDRVFRHIAPRAQVVIFAGFAI